MGAINGNFFSGLSQAVSGLKEKYVEESKIFEQAVHQCEKEQLSEIALPASSIEILSQTLQAKCAHLFKAVSPLIRKEFSRLSKQPSLSRKRKPEKTSDHSTPEAPECKRQKREDSHLPEVQDTEERKIRDITDIIGHLRADPSRGLTLLQSRIPYYMLPAADYSIPQKFEQAFGDLIHKSIQQTLHSLEDNELPTEKHETSWCDDPVMAECSIM